MPYCQHCGAEHSDDASFCPRCGSWVAAVGGLPGIAAPTRYAGFWWRVGAYLIDALIVGIPFSVANSLLVSPPANMNTTTDQAGNVNTSFTGNWTAFLIVLAAFMVCNWLYVALLLSSPRQGTVGKMALGLIVTDEHGERLSFGRASGRHFANLLNSLTLGIGYLMVIWTSRKQALHDKVAGTLVVPKPA